METFENIRILREKRGLSQESLAEMTGYRDRSSIAKIEAGLVDLSESKIAAFARALSVSPAELMGFSVEPSPAASDSSLKLSPEALEIAIAYDCADEKSKGLVRYTLDEYMPAKKQDTGMVV